MSTSAPRVVCMGEILIDFMAAPSVPRLEDAEYFVPKAGGAPANVAVGLRRLEVPSGFIGMVGDDAFGRLLRNTLEAECVDIRSLAETGEQPTTLAFVALDNAGKPDFSFYRHPGADLSLRMQDVDIAVLESARVFHFGSLSLVAPPAAETTAMLLEQARQRRMFVSYDPNYRPALWHSENQAKARMTAHLANVDLIKVSDEELALLTGESDPVRACELLGGQGPNNVVVTRGADGILGWTPDGIVEVPGIPVEVVDTTGCGDSATAGVIAKLLDLHPDLHAGFEVPKASLAEALQFANRCAAHTASRLGAIPALPHSAELV